MLKSFIYKSKYLNSFLQIEYTNQGIVRLEFKIKKSFQLEYTQKTSATEKLILKKCNLYLDKYFAKKRAECIIPMELNGTSLQLKVWNELMNIPFGTVISYAELAKRVGKPKAVRAVGTAVGKNPIPLLIPCHRVIRSNGEIGNYSGGVSIKEKLLKLEL